MMLFVQEKKADEIRLLVIPLEKVGAIEMIGCVLRIWYNNGDLEEVSNGSAVPVMSEYIKHYESSSETLRVARDFYLACKRNDLAFCF